MPMHNIPMQGMLMQQGLPMQQVMPTQQGLMQSMPMQNIMPMQQPVAMINHSNSQGEYENCDDEESCESSDADSEAKHEKTRHSKISRSTIKLSQAPDSRLAAACERIDPHFDASFVSELNKEGVLQLLWYLTRVKPFTHISTLRVKCWNEFCQVMCRANARVKARIGAETMQAQVNTLFACETMLLSHTLKKLVEDFG